MESLGVISKVSGPTEWCAAMVVVPKKNGEVRICVNSESIKPEHAKGGTPNPFS